MSDQTLHDVCVVATWSFCIPQHVHLGDANTRFPLVRAGTSRQKAQAANPVGDFLGLAHFAACLDVGHGARRQLLQRLDCILFARTMGSVCRDCQISENLLEQPSVSGDAGCGFAGDDDDVCRVRFQEVRVLPENPPRPRHWTKPANAWPAWLGADGDHEV